MRVQSPTGQQQRLNTQAEDNLYRALVTRGLLEAPCGGRGLCGKCAVRFISTPPPAVAREQEALSAEQLRQGWRLACLHNCGGPDTLLELPQPLGDGMEGACWNTTNTSLQPDAASGLGLALDIGTTTLCAALIELRNGEELASAACLNSQRVYGQDVISRISHAQSSPQGLTELRTTLLNDINGLLTRLCQPLCLDTEQISMAVVAANPAMAHIFAGIDPTPLGQAPYTPAFNGTLDFKAAELGLPLYRQARLYVLPAAAAYVGGDILAGLLATKLHLHGITRLFIDIGTNGEIVLAHRGQLIACSTAAGPALEGMNISCGMRAAPGAVSAVEISENRVHYSTIGNLPALGLAGSGVLSAITALLQAGLVDKNGRLKQQPPLTKEDGERRFIISPDAGIVLTQGDIRQVQLAKGAIRAGVESLLAASNCPAEQVDQVLVAGGFGAHLPEQSLLGVGLLPPQLAGKIAYAGNTALAGARLCLLSAELRRQAEQLAQQIDYLELAHSKEYQQRFMQAIHFA